MPEIVNAYSNFFFPLLINHLSYKQLLEKLEEANYKLYDVDSAPSVDYGDGLADDYEHLRNYFMPNVEHKLLDNDPNGESFLRFTKQHDLACTLTVDNQEHPFKLINLEVIVCPFSLVFLLIRTKHSEEATKEQAENFIQAFRTLQKKQKFQLDKQANETYETTEAFLQKVLIADLPTLFRKKKGEKYTNSFSNFQDKKLIASNFITFYEAHEAETLFYLNEGHGTHKYDELVKPYISKNYIERYLDEHVLERYDDHINYIQAEETGTITTYFPVAGDSWKFFKRYYNSSFFYQLLIHYFQNITLLTLANEYANVKWKKDQSYVRELMKKISLFDARYHFAELSTYKEENELTEFLQKSFGITKKYEETIHSLNQLFTNQEQLADLKQNNLLFFLTMSSVITGVFGMNLIVDRWKNGISMKEVTSYTGIESFIFIVTAISIIAALLLTGQRLYELVVEQWRRIKKSKMK
ncbi:MAG: hypothetical protein KBT36_05565 [Kurthia sp.]|nr:hypothetical protein [Candidatus Kurthia equi]